MAVHRWEVWARNPGYAPSVFLPISALQGVRRHLGVDTCVLTTPFTPAAWEAVGPTCGLVVSRDAVQQFTGLTAARQLDWDKQSGRAVIKVEAVGDDQGLADRLVFPDPLRAPDDQTVNDYWTYTGIASTAMQRLISDQAGPTCAADRRIPGLVLGADPGVGTNRAWSGLFDSSGPQGVLDQLAVMSVASGENLGVRLTSTAGTLTADIIRPRDLTAAVQFSADLGNLVGFSYRETAPTVTDAVSAGQGDLHARLRAWVTTSSVLALGWGRRIFRYVDRRDTADSTVLTQAATDEVAQGAVTVNLQVTLTDSQAATYGVDWDLGDALTVRVGLPQQVKIGSVSDVCREIAFTVNDKGAETLAPAIGSYDAKAILPTPSQQQLTDIGVRLAGLIARK